jgi:RimJ/RimL family protein N-acetyltransferase
VIADDNGPSLALAARLGFERSGEGVYYGKRLGRYRVEAPR